ncbi:MAG: NUDIX hydrolase [Clostridia bacterium]|nr:NUDIX hydrolase [Clostridia bacterium]
MKIFPKHIIAVGGIILNDKEEVLLVHTPKSGWVFPGGQVENEENLIDALKREVLEESGIHIEVDRLIGLYSNTKGYPGYNGYEDIPTKLMIDFTGHYIEGELTASDETDACKWVKKEDVLNLMTSVNYIERYEAFLHQTTLVTYMDYVTKPEFTIKMKREI